jgi:hypothetical protein
LAEAFSTLVGALIEQPENLQDHLKKSKATEFYGNIAKLTDDDYLMILAIPTNYSLDNSEVTVNLSMDLKKFKEILTEIKIFYFENLDLFNSYKHGFRIFPLLTLDDIGNSTSTIMYFSNQQGQHNQVFVRRLTNNPDAYLEIAKLISATFCILLDNLKNKSINGNEWKVSIPAKNVSTNE